MLQVANLSKEYPTPRGPLPVLPLGTDQGAQNERRRQADQRVEEINGLEGGEKPHAAFLGERRDGPITTPTGRHRASTDNHIVIAGRIDI